MTAQSGRDGSWTISAHVAASAIAAIRELQIHPQFTAYLALRRAVAQGRSGDVSEIKRFMDDFLRVRGAPTKAPYLRLFNETRPSPQTLWGHPNVAGNFAPRSLRPGSPLVRIVRVPETPYLLRDNHYEIALATMTKNAIRLPVCRLALALFRDYGIVGERTHETLVDAFCFEFGVVRDGLEFETLYVIDDEFALV